MKHKLAEKLAIPEGITCTYKDKVFSCSKDGVELSRKMTVPKTDIKIGNNEITFECAKANKNQYKHIQTNISHIKNMFAGLQDKYIYELEAVNVHFPMTLKVEGNLVKIANFLGEKTPREAVIKQNVEVEVKGQKIIVTSADKEAAGQTASNIERATKVKGRDRRIYQDGIYIVSKSGGNQ